jgi:hypothetical protein
VLIESANRLIGGGKEGRYYVLDANTLGQAQKLQAFNNVFHPYPDWHDVTIPDLGWWGSPHLHGQPVYWNGLIYQQAEFDNLKAYRLANGTLSAAPFVGSDHRVSPFSPAFMRTQLSASSNGNTAGSAVVWTTLQARDDAEVNANPQVGCDGRGTVVNRLTAYNAGNLSCLWSTNTGNKIAKHSPPTVVAGRVILLTEPDPPNREVRVYRLGGGAGGCPSPPLRDFADPAHHCP